MRKTVEQMTRKEFEALPYRKSWSEDVICNSIVILPGRRLHDSGYRVMDFVAVDKNAKPMCRLAGGSDVLHIGGIGGYSFRLGGSHTSVPPVGWQIDCLPKSGLLQLNVLNHGEMIAGIAISSFEVFWRKRD